jgi:hypothetical protein
MPLLTSRWWTRWVFHTTHVRISVGTLSDR